MEGRRAGRDIQQGRLDESTIVGQNESLQGASDPGTRQEGRGHDETVSVRLRLLLRLRGGRHGELLEGRQLSIIFCHPRGDRVYGCVFKPVEFRSGSCNIMLLMHVSDRQEESVVLSWEGRSCWEESVCGYEEEFCSILSVVPASWYIVLVGREDQRFQCQ